MGRAIVIDGDTIEIRGEKVRLNGVDAPESWQRCENGDGAEYRCGKEAAFELDRFLADSRPTRCDFVERDRYGRFVGVCFRADGREVNRWLVESGNAVDWEKYSKGAYADAQGEAKARGAGIWRPFPVTVPGARGACQAGAVLLIEREERLINSWAVG